MKYATPMKKKKRLPIDISIIMEDDPLRNIIRKCVDFNPLTSSGGIFV